VHTPSTTRFVSLREGENPLVRQCFLGENSDLRREEAGFWSGGRLVDGEVLPTMNRSPVIGKRKAENQVNERLSKRMSLLNLERNGQKLYVPVEQPSVNSISASPSKLKSPAAQTQDDDIMQVDDTKHKVYIYDLDAELSDSESSDDGRLVFLPDIQKHLRETRIPQTILANSKGELAGMNNQLVLYNVPSSLTVPEELDSVRKAIIETRARARTMRKQKRIEDTRDAQTSNAPTSGIEERDLYNAGTNGVSPEPQQRGYDDPDAMDLS